jgi:hypothetical protein
MFQSEGAGSGLSRVLRVTADTSHPQLCQALRRDKRWRQLSATMFGTNKKKSAATIAKAGGAAAGYGGHMRAVQGFRFYGQQGLAAAR